MIVVTGIKYITIPDGSYYDHFSYDSDRFLHVKRVGDFQNEVYEVVKVQGHRFFEAHEGSEIMPSFAYDLEIGMVPEAEQVLRLPFEAISNLRDECSKLRDENHDRNSLLKHNEMLVRIAKDKIENAGVWVRLKYLFTGELS